MCLSNCHKYCVIAVMMMMMIMLMTMQLNGSNGLLLNRIADIWFWNFRARKEKCIELENRYSVHCNVLVCVSNAFNPLHSLASQLILSRTISPTGKRKSQISTFRGASHWFHFCLPYANCLCTHTLSRIRKLKRHWMRNRIWIVCVYVLCIYCDASIAIIINRPHSLNSFLLPRPFGF